MAPWLPGGTVHAQHRCLVKAATKKRALELLVGYRLAITASDMRDYWCETGNKIELEKTASVAEGVWYSPLDDYQSPPKLMPYFPSLKEAQLSQITAQEVADRIVRKFPQIEQEVVAPLLRREIAIAFSAFVEAEREACAKLAEEDYKALTLSGPGANPFRDLAKYYGAWIAAAIRARNTEAQAQ